MPTAEGVFPKLGGDPLYYSEANAFNYASRFLAVGSTNTLGSGTSIGSVLGSVLIGAGSLKNPSSLDIYFIHKKNIAQPLQIHFSGTNAGNATPIVNGSTTSASTSRAGYFRYILGSDSNGFSGLAFAFSVSAASTLNGPLNDITSNHPTEFSSYSNNTINNFNPGSEFVIFFETSGNSAMTSYIPSYWIQGYKVG